MQKKTVTVTQPFLPPLEEFIPYLEEIWDSRWLTNNGQFHQRLEAELCEYLGVEYISLFTNATIALITALRALEISGEVITTPYSFVATTHSLYWNRIQPVFVDIDPRTMNIDARKIEAAITANTTAIMPVHCYGRPCETEEIQRIADQHNLKVIYDAAHCFGVQKGKASLLNQGDLSVVSFHATKVFTTFEGGALICKDAATKASIDFLKNFGIADEVTVVGPGINGKMNEIQAAFGLLQLQHIDEAIALRQKVDSRYRDHLHHVKGLSIPELPGNVKHNYGYFPVIVNDPYGESRDQLYARLRTLDIHARRYFYPLISDFPPYDTLPSAAAENLPNARDIANRIICLPIYPDLTICEQDKIIEAIRR